MKIEVLTLPVTDVDRALAFYTQAGFTLDVDYHPTKDFRVVQLTPPGSAVSVQFGLVLTDAPPAPPVPTTSWWTTSTPPSTT